MKNYVEQFDMIGIFEVCKDIKIPDGYEDSVGFDERIFPSVDGIFGFYAYKVRDCELGDFVALLPCRVKKNYKKSMWPWLVTDILSDVTPCYKENDREKFIEIFDFGIGYFDCQQWY